MIDTVRLAKRTLTFGSAMYSDHLTYLVDVLGHVTEDGLEGDLIFTLFEVEEEGLLAVGRVGRLPGRAILEADVRRFLELELVVYEDPAGREHTDQRVLTEADRDAVKSRFGNVYRILHPLVNGRAVNDIVSDLLRVLRLGKARGTVVLRIETSV